MESKDFKSLAIIGILVLTIIFMAVVVADSKKQRLEAKSKLLSIGVTANSVRCTLEEDPASCASAAAEDRSYANKLQENFATAQSKD